MKHYGDITKLNGSELTIVDVITGGSPCQDLSIAGQRKGLAGERSGLFMEQIRIIKEMRDESKRRLQSRGPAFNIRCVQPRYMVWENVPGAFSSNKGEDFRAVLEETAKIADENAVIPRPSGKWTNSGCIMGDGWSIAWRVHDAQFWGVPQRRKRIALVADFGGQSAPEILFDKQGLSGDFEPGGTERKEASRAVGNGVKKASGFSGWKSVSGDIQYQKERPTIERNMPPNAYCPQGNGIDRADTAGCNGKGWRENESYTPNTVDRPAVAYSFDSLSSNSMKSKNPFSGCREVEISKTLDCFDPNPSKNQGGIAVVQSIYDARGNGDGNICPTITGDHENRITDYTAITYQEVTGTLSPGAHPGSYNGQDAYNDMLVAYAPDVARPIKAKANCDFREDSETYCVTAVDCRNGTENPDTNGTLQAKSTGGMSVNLQNVCRQGTVVRRLTPLECERLQGYPDGWTMFGKPFGFETWKDQDGNEYKFQKYIYKDENGKIKKVSDSARYKALGNSIALPFWQWMAQRICNQYDRQVTMGSLFDGISGFPLVFARAGAMPLWTSEIEEFAIAVCKAHFGDEDAGIEGDIEKYL